MGVSQTERVRLITGKGGVDRGQPICQCPRNRYAPGLALVNSGCRVLDDTTSSRHLVEP